jgi:hypothetical protein
LKGLCGDSKLAGYADSAETLEILNAVVRDTAQARRNAYKDAEKADEFDQAAYLRACKPMLVVIDGFDNFFSLISDASLKNYEFMLPVAYSVRLYIIVSAVPSELGRYASTTTYKQFFGGGYGLLLGGGFNDQKVYKSNLSFKQGSALFEPGEGYFFSKGKYKIVRLHSLNS